MRQIHPRKVLIIRVVDSMTGEQSMCTVVCQTQPIPMWVSPPTLQPHEVFVLEGYGKPDPQVNWGYAWGYIQ